MSRKNILNILTEKLKVVYKDDTEVLQCVLFYLTQEKEAYQNRDGPAFRILKCVLDVDSAFEEWARHLADDIKIAEDDKNFKQFIGTIYSQMMDGGEVIKDVEKSHHSSLVEKLKRVLVEATPGFIRAVAVMQLESKLQVKDVENTFSYRANGLTAGLAALYLSIRIREDIRKWRNDKITGVRCYKNIIDEVSTLAASIAGGYAGVSIGASLGPFSLFTGGVFGGMLAAEVVSKCVDWLTQTIFNIPKGAALENAYVYFGLNKSASNHEINIAYRKKCLQHNPDKVGDYKEFQKVQIYMATIKAAKRQH